jgi:FLVCR family MFS transporter 7
VIMTALKDDRPVDLDHVRQGGRTNGGGNRPAGHMFWALVFQAVVSLAVLPLPLMLGIRRLGLATREGRLIKDQDGDSVVERTGTGGEEDGNAGRTSAGQ